MSHRRLIAAAVVAAFVVVLVVAFVAAPRLASNAAGTAPHFVEEAAAAGVAHAYTGDDYFVGGGVAAFDCNGDGLDDLYLAGGESAAALYVNASSRRGALRFSALPSPATDLAQVTGAYPIDIDSDGVTDLAALRHGENVLLRGLGACRFERANEEWGFQGGDQWSTAFSAKWDPGATWPTIAIGNYLADDAPGGLKHCLDNTLVGPSEVGGGFGVATPLAPGWCTLSLLFSDWDRSGRRDLRVSNDRHYYRDDSAGQEQLWRVVPGETPRELTVADGWQRLRVFGMGIASYDVTGDGLPDYFLSSQADNKLQTLADGSAQPDFKDIAVPMNATAAHPYEGDTTLPSTAWHAEFQDVNNDGQVDLFIAKGNVSAEPDYARLDPSNLLIGQPDGTFVEGAQEAGIVDYEQARGGALVDLNSDGMLDLVVVDRLADARIYRNVGTGTVDAPAPMNNWLAVDLRDQAGNRDAIGAWIEVRTASGTQQREHTIGGGHASGELGPLHFGLGTSTSADVRITWPDGTPGDWQPVGANATYLIERGAAPVVANR